MKCVGCGKNHDFAECPLREEIKELIIARLEAIPDNIRISIG